MSKLGRYSADRKKITALTAATKTVAVSECGTVFTLAGATTGVSAIAVTLPNASSAGSGWWCKFILLDNPRTNDYTISATAGDGDNMYAATMYASGNAATIEGGSSVPSTAGSGSAYDVITINKNVAVPGDQIEVLSDGSNWFVTSLTYAFNAVTLA